MGDILGDSANFTIPGLLRFQSEKGQKVERTRVKICAVPTQQDWRKNKAQKEKKKQQGCDVAKVIDTVEQAVSTAKKVYRVIEPVGNAFTNRPKTK
jgi:hypothetical protein